MAMNEPEIDRITTPIPYQRFFDQYLVGNQPCLLASSFTDSWPCRTLWVAAHGGINFAFLSSKYGNMEVPVTDCDTQTGYGSARTETAKFRDYLDYLEMESDLRSSCKYLKDWHFQRHLPEDGCYSVPEYFSSDWLNEYCDSDMTGEDYRFVYLGPAGSWTPLHEDVLESFSWSANISGRKKWFIFPPGEEEKLRIGGQLAADVRVVDLGNVRHAVVFQEAGEILFVPSRWYHQVHNLEDTLSINHNWMNSANARSTWRLLSELLEKVEEEIADCRAAFDDDMTSGQPLEWMRQCQRILKADVGMDFGDFRRMLAVVSENRKLHPTGSESAERADEWLWGRDMACIRDLLRNMDNHRFFSQCKDQDKD